MKFPKLAERLFWARRKADITQLELRDLMMKKYEVEIGRNYISEIEHPDKDDPKNPTFEVVAAMAGALEVSLDYLAGFTDEPAVARGVEPATPYISPEADEVAQIVDRMSLDQRKVVLDVTRNMSSLALERTLRQAEIRDILDSVEREMGRAARDDFERILRSKGIYHGGV